MNSLKAILCDDEPAVIEHLQTMLHWKELNIHTIGTASDGKTALQMILEKEPDVAIMDIRMPGMDGLETIRRAKNAGSSTEFVILSGYHEFEYAKEAVKLGAKAYLLKPLDSQELYDILYRICFECMKNKGNVIEKKRIDTSFFKNLVEGRIMEPSMVDSMLLRSMESLTNSECYVMLVELDRKRNERELKSIGREMEKTLSGEHYFIYPSGDSRFTILLNTSDHLPLHLAEKLRRMLTENGYPDCEIGIGDIVPNLLQCSYSNNRAMNAMTYRLYGNSNRIYTSEDICTSPPVFKPGDIDILPLVQSIVKLDREGISKFCRDFMDQVMYVRMPPPNYVISTCFAFYNRIEKEFEGYSHDEIVNVLSPEDLFHAESVGVIREWLIRSFTQLSEYIDAVYGYGHQKQDEGLVDDNDELIAKAMAYIHNNVTNDLSIDSISSHVCLSPRYFAVYFKQKTGRNLRDCILAEKMEYARKALFDSETLVVDLAQRLGYQDYRGFSRAFKNIHHMTPSDFQMKYKR